MKCIKDKTTEIILRVTDLQAFRMVKADPKRYSYTRKSTWKSQRRNG